MASSPEFVEFVCDLLEGAGEVRSRKMFGDYVVYVCDKPVVLVCDNTAYVKMIPELGDLLADAATGRPYEGAREHYILDVDRRDEMLRAVAVLVRVLPLPRRRAARKKKTAE